ncbi:MAG: hypothetical protein NXI18_15445 [Alphaproteobacteria bacterium]|nr:hypothetical protein [Alphaproteobacteria bacterium]
MHRPPPRPGPASRLSVLTLTLTVSLSACLTSPPPPPAEGIGYRAARFAEIEAMRAYRACRDEGLSLDRQARAGGDAGRYLAVARILEGCEADLGTAAASLNVEERMRAYGVSVLARLKGGDVAGARNALDRFGAAFDGRDLFFDDGASFIDSVAAVLDGGPVQPGASVPRPLAEELARIGRWAR